MKKSNKISYLKKNDSVKEVFDKIYRENFSRLYYFATTLTKSEEVAKDVVSDVFVNLWKAGTDFGKIRDIESYLFISVKNQAIQVISQRSKRPISLDMEDTIHEIDRTSPEEVLLEKELLNALEEVIQLLPDQCQLVFRMAREENMSYQEISDKLGIHVSTVKSHMIKAIADVRNHISSMYDEDQENSGASLGLISITLVSYLASVEYLT